MVNQFEMFLPTTAQSKKQTANFMVM